MPGRLHLRVAVWFALYCVPLPNASAQSSSLVDALRAVAADNDLQLVFSASVVPDTSVTLPNPALPLREALVPVLAPFDLTYSLAGGQLVISRRDRPEYSTLSGFVEDASSRERLPGATVYLARTTRGAYTNGYGYFALVGVEPGDSLVVRYVGYPPDTVVMNDELDRKITIRLTANVELQAVEVFPERLELSALPIDGKILPTRALERTSLTVGRQDINLWLANQPGVTSGAGGYGGYSIRGNNPEHNLVLLDDATLYLPSHAAGLVSVVPGEAIQGLQLHKDPGPASYGDRVGGVVDVRLKDGSREGRRTSVGLGLTDLRATTEGPLARGSYFVSGRYGLTDLWLNALRGDILPDESRIPNVNYDFHDVAAKVNYPLGERQRIYASVFTGRDAYSDEANAVASSDTGTVERLVDRSARLWSNLTSSLRYTAAVKEEWFVSATATLSRFRYLAEDNLTLTRLSASTERVSAATGLFDTRLTDLGLKADLEYAATRELRVKLGFDAVNHRFRVGAIGTEQQAIDSTEAPTPPPARLPAPLSTFESSVYVSARWQPGDAFDVDFGVRASSQLAEGANFGALLPRLRVACELTPRWSVTGSGGLGRQYLHRVSTLNPGLPRDVWVPSVDILTPQRTRYASVGLAYNEQDGLKGSVSYYRSDLAGLARFGPNFVSVDYEGWADNVSRGTGRNYGAEVQVAYELLGVGVQVGYGYARASRRFTDQTGRKLPRERAALDRRHTLNVSLDRKVGDHWEFGTRWTYGSGLPTRLPSRDPFASDQPGTNLPLTNNWVYDGPQVQLPDYHTLNVGTTFAKDVKGGRYRVSLGVQNAYLRKNPVFVNLQATNATSGGRSYRFTQVYMFRVLPFASLDYSF